MPAKTLMVQGTGSSVGKSILVAALCRIFRQAGWRVAPFKAQNMSLNSFVTRTGGEIGRAQAVQAAAAQVEPTVEMNPILLKPEADNRSQVVVRGRPTRVLDARSYFSLNDELWPVVTESLDRLIDDFDLVVMEGAGSPAEVNLKDRDLVNMRVARHCRSPVLLVGDIERGGVFASLVGTLDLLDKEEQSLVRGLIVNKFRGDITLFDSGRSWLEERTGRPVLGVIPYFKDIHIPEEDSVSLERRRSMKAEEGFDLDIAVIGLPHISNFDDFDPLAREPGVRLRFVEGNDSLGEPDLIILPGTKSTIADLQGLWSSGRSEQIIARARRGTPVVGICGGFQMLGQSILDPEGIESREPSCRGLGLLPVTTSFEAVKSTHQVKARILAEKGLLGDSGGGSVTGYEIHMGQTEAVGEARPAFRVEERSGQACRDSDGCLSADGNVLGTYIHGLFDNDALRGALLGHLASRKGTAFTSSLTLDAEREYDKLAEWVRSALDMARLFQIVERKDGLGIF